MEPRAERPRKKPHQRKIPPATQTPGSIGRQARDSISGPSNNDRMEIGGILDAILLQNQYDFGVLSMGPDQASSPYPIIKMPDSSPRIADYGSPKDKLSRIQEPIQIDKLTKISDPATINIGSQIAGEHSAPGN